MWTEKLSDGATVAEIVFNLLVIVLLISGLVVRRRGRGGAYFKYGTVWVLVAALLLIGYGMKDGVARMGRSILAELLPQKGAATDNSITFRESINGHFSIEADVDGETMVFTLDSGATDVILSPADAERIGYDPEELHFDKPYRTANGVVNGAPIRLRKVTIGPIVLEDVRASVNGAPMPTSLLGMSFLSRLSSWHVEGDRLTLTR